MLLHCILPLMVHSTISSSDEEMYFVVAGNVTTLPCDSASGSQLYFSEEANNIVTARRSVTIRGVPVFASECPTGSVPGRNIHVCHVCVKTYPLFYTLL